MAFGMADCRNCGAPIGAIESQPVLCRFCDTPNDPPPKQVPVPVPVQVVHNVVQVMGDSGQAFERRCPHCRKRLVTVRASNVELSGCGACGGVWIDNDSARRVLEAPDAVFAELAHRAGENATKRQRANDDPVCAACPALLDHVTTHGIALDVCSEHGTWFDAYELTQLVRTLRGEATSRTGFPANRTVKCQICGGVLQSDRANLTDEGLACENCWRNRQAAVFAAANAETQRDGAIAFGGALLGVAGVMLGAAVSSSRR
jgi:Zn-finger nucleic acid-binding protein